MWNSCIPEIVERDILFSEDRRSMDDCDDRETFELEYYYRFSIIFCTLLHAMRNLCLHVSNGPDLRALPFSELKTSAERISSKSVQASNEGIRRHGHWLRTGSRI